MKRLSLIVVSALLALPSSALAASFVAELGSPFPTRPATYGITVNDFDGDGTLDVAAVNGLNGTSVSNNISIYLRQATGGFAEEAGSPVAAPFGANYVVSGDFAGDARPDLAVVAFGQGGTAALRILERSGANTGFTPAGEYPVSAGGSAIASADFNGDGALDLVVGNWNGATVNVLTRMGTGFSAEAAYPVGANPRQIAVGDFNGDGRPDLAVSNAGGTTVSILLRNTAGTAFVSEGAVTVGLEPWGVGTGDFNGDGRVDVAASSAGEDTVRLLLRNASGDGFTATAPVAAPDRPQDLAVADFDRNGTPDVAVASFAAGALTVLSGGTALEPSIAVPGAYAPAVADFNADQRPDLALTSTAGNFSSFLNSTPAPQPPPPPPGPTPTPAPVAPLPEPVAGRNVNATPVAGTVKVKLPGSRSFIDLSQAQQLPVGTSVDARRGTVELKAANQGGTAKFFDGLFKISAQTKGRRPLTTLTLTEPLSCPKGKQAGAAAKKRSRKLWGDGKGAFRTSGRYSAATVRGTKWLVTDRCDTTTTRVTQGSVTVRDFVKRRTVVVRAGRSYTARKR